MVVVCLGVGLLVGVAWVGLGGPVVVAEVQAAAEVVWAVD